MRVVFGRVAIIAGAMVVPCLPNVATSTPLKDFPVASTTDLTEPLHTKKPWSVIVTTEPDDPETNDLGVAHIYFIRDGAQQCLGPEILGNSDGDCRPTFDPQLPQYNGFGVGIVRPFRHSQSPILKISAWANFGTANTPVTTMLWAYRPRKDAFDLVFSAKVYANANEETRIIETGPLAGLVVVAREGHKAPWGYDVSVYRQSTAQHYVLILHYIAGTRYGDGNRLAVIDSEMAEIERRLGFWKPGDPLPVPLRMPDGCHDLTLHKHAEWCE